MRERAGCGPPSSPAYSISMAVILLAGSWLSNLHVSAWPTISFWRCESEELLFVDTRNPPVLYLAPECERDALCSRVLRAAHARSDALGMWKPYTHARAAAALAAENPPQTCAVDVPSSTRLSSIRVVVAQPDAGLTIGVDESYSLRTLEAEVLIESATVWGALRALETLAQVLSPGMVDGVRRLTGCLGLAVSDKPAYKWRGLLIDVARHWWPMPALLRVLDAMSALKLNVLHLHLTDSQSFPLVGISAWPGLGSRTSWCEQCTYSAAQLGTLAAEAEARGIILVPELDTPGHSAAIGVAYPHLVAACPLRIGADELGPEHGIDHACLRWHEPDALRLVRDLVQHVAGAVPGAYLHLGFDEVDAQCSLEDLRARRVADRSEGAPSAAAHARLGAELVDFASAVIGSVRANGRRAIVWDDALDLLAQLAPAEREGMIVQVWRGWLNAADLLVRRAAALGLDVIVSAGYYLDYDDPWTVLYDRDVLASHGVHSARVLGGTAASWSEVSDHASFDATRLAKLAAAAERFWVGPRAAGAAAGESAHATQLRLAHFLCQLRRRGFKPAPVMPDHCDVA